MHPFLTREEHYVCFLDIDQSKVRHADTKNINDEHLVLDPVARGSHHHLANLHVVGCDLRLPDALPSMLR
jgi:hypothetical protein